MDDEEEEDMIERTKTKQRRSKRPPAPRPDLYLFYTVLCLEESKVTHFNTNTNTDVLFNDRNSPPGHFDVYYVEYIIELEYVSLW